MGDVAFLRLQLYLLVVSSQLSSMDRQTSSAFGSTLSRNPRVVHRTLPRVCAPSPRHQKPSPPDGHRTTVSGPVELIAGPGRVRNDGPGGDEQHEPADDRGRGQAGAGDGSLRPGVARGDPARQPPCRRTGRVGGGHRHSPGRWSTAWLEQPCSPTNFPGSGRRSTQSTPGWGSCRRSRPGCRQRRKPSDLILRAW